MRAVVLVGGFGTRLRPLTTHTPKQMLPIVGRPMIERVIAKLAAGGVTDAVLALGYRPDAFIEAYPDDTCAGVTLHYAVESEPLDTAGAVRFAALDGGIEHTFLVVNGDVLTDLDIGQLWEFHHRTGAEGTIALTPVDDPSRYGVVPIDGDGRVEAFVEKPPPGEAPTNWINAGTYVLEPSVLDRIPAGQRVSIERQTFPAMVDDRALFALHSDAYWVDAGTPSTYLQVQLDLIDGVRGPAERAVDPSAVVAAEAEVAHSVVMAGAQVDPDAVVRDSVVLPGARIGRGAVVDGSIVGARAVVGVDAVVHHLSVVGQDATVRSGRRARRGQAPGGRPGVKALVTGGAGFIGSNLVDRLLAEGHAVDVIDSLVTGSLANLSDARADRDHAFSFHQIDIREPSVVDLIVRRKPEVVFHLAAQADVRVSVSQPVFDAQVNVIGSLNVMEGARQAGSRKVVFASSGGTIYGAPDAADLPVDETHAQHPISPYGVAKKAVGDYLYAYRELHALEFAALAMANVYGPRQDPHGEAGVVAIFAGHLLADEACTIYGDGTQTRDYVYVDDVVDAFVRAADRGSGLLANIGTGLETSVNDLYASMARATGVERAAVHAPARPGELARSSLDPGRAGLYLGWKPWTDLDTGTTAVLDWFRQNRR